MFVPILTVTLFELTVVNNWFIIMVRSHFTNIVRSCFIVCLYKSIIKSINRIFQMIFTRKKFSHLFYSVFRLLEVCYFLCKCIHVHVYTVPAVFLHVTNIANMEYIFKKTLFSVVIFCDFNSYVNFCYFAI